MMEVEIEIDKDIKKKIEIQEPKKNHQIEWLKKGWSFDTSKNPNTIKEFLDYIDTLIAELTGLSLKEVEDMPLVEKNKIRRKIESRFNIFATEEIKNL